MPKDMPRICNELIATMVCRGTGQWIIQNGKSMLRMLFFTLAHMFSFNLQIYIQRVPHKIFRINYEHLPELDAKWCWGSLQSQNRPMNHLLKMAANVKFFCNFCHFLLYVGMPWHAESMLRKPQVHWHDVEAGNTEVNLWETRIATCPN